MRVVRLVMSAIICFFVCIILLLCSGGGSSSAIAQRLPSRACPSRCCARDEIVRIATLPQMGRDDICGYARSAGRERGWATANTCLCLLGELVREDGAGCALAEIDCKGRGKVNRRRYWYV